MAAGLRVTDTGHCVYAPGEWLQACTRLGGPSFSLNPAAGDYVAKVFGYNDATNTVYLKNFPGWNLNPLSRARKGNFVTLVGSAIGGTVGGPSGAIVGGVIAGYAHSTFAR